MASISTCWCWLSVYRGAAIPAYWLPPDKRGNSGGRERMALLQRFIGRFGKSRINRPLAGRGFVGDQWMAWLTKQQIPFFIRIRNNSISANSRGQKTRVEQLFYTLKPGEIKCLPHSRPLGQCTVCLNALRLADGGLLLVASNRLAQDAVTIYGLRWEIETLLGCLKGRGFKLEETRVLDHLRIKKLLVLPWPHLAGPLRPAIGNTVVCCPSRPKHTSAAQSIFRYGLDCIRAGLFNVFSRSLKRLRKLFPLRRPQLHLRHFLQRFC